jgi:hypothetical protein
MTNIYTSNTRAPKYMNQIWHKQKEKQTATHNSRRLQYPAFIMTMNQKINKEIEDLNNTTDQMYPTNINRTLHWKHQTITF